MGITEDYRVFIKTPTGRHKSHPMTKIDSILYTARYLDNIQALECLTNGCWLKTKCRFTGDADYYKRYWIVVSIPYTEITIKKESTGSMPVEDFERLLKYIKDNYHEKF